MTLAVELNNSPLVQAGQPEIAVGQHVLVTEYLFERRGVTGGIEWDQPIADVQTFAGRVATVPNVEDPAAPQTYHVQRQQQPTFIVPTYDVPIRFDGIKRPARERFSRFVIEAV